MSACILACLYFLSEEPASDSFSCPTCNLILITVDTLRPDHLGYNGYSRATSPHIDRLAAQSFILENVTTTRTNTTPSLSSFMTGLEPRHHGVRDIGERLADSYPTLATILASHGFTTGAFVSNPVLAPEVSGLHRGFITYDSGSSVVTGIKRDAETMNKAVVSWLKSNTAGRIFLWIHYMDPHGPYSPPGDERARAFTHQGREPIPISKVPPYQHLEFLPADGDGHVDRLDYVDMYDSEIQYLDRHLGETLEHLGSMGFLEKSLVLFSADHGESLGEHLHYFSHGREVYDATARIPLLIRFPQTDLQTGKRFPEVVSTTDLLPTILEYLKVPFDHRGDGSSLLSLFRKGKWDRTDAPTERVEDGKVLRFALRESQKKAMLIGRKTSSAAPVMHCFDLKRDPQENNPLSCESPEFEELARKTRKSSLLLMPARATPVVTMSESDARTLHSLGYLN